MKRNRLCRVLFGIVLAVTVASTSVPAGALAAENGDTSTVTVTDTDTGTEDSISDAEAQTFGMNEGSQDVEGSGSETGTESNIGNDSAAYIPEDDSQTNVQDDTDSSNNSDITDANEPGSASSDGTLTGVQNISDNAVKDGSDGVPSDSTENNEENISEIEADTVLDSVDKLTANAVSTVGTVVADVHIEEKDIDELSILDRIHFISTGNSDSMLVESNGLYGLIDSSNPSTTGGSNKYTAFNSGANNGKTVAQYLQSVGVDTLSFVLATHNHSDHIGGMSDIADAVNAAGNSLINSSTVYIYKPYVSVNWEDKAGWHNDYYYQRALEAMSAKGAVLLNTTAPSSAALKALGASLNKSVTGDKIGDNISFNLGDFSFRLFNLYTVSTSNENSNSIVTLVQKENKSALLTADIDGSGGVEKRMVNAVSKYSSNITVYKSSHHGYSGTGYTALSTFHPSSIVVTTGTTGSEPRDDTCYSYYAADHNIGVYRTSDARGAVIADFSEMNACSILTNGLDSSSMQPAKSWTAARIAGFHKWKESDGTDRYVYVNSAGEVVTGWNTISGNTYYMNGDGVTQIGPVKRNGKVYYFNPSSCKLVKSAGWNKYNNTWYYVNSDGTVKTGWYKIKKTWYYSDGMGAMKTGWQKISNKWYYFNGSGAMQTGWQKIGGKTYYIDGWGIMQTGWQRINKKWYYFNSSGAMHTGWYNSNNKWYYFNGSGVMQTGWQKIGGKTYYIDGWGVMQTGWQRINKKWYYFNRSGVMHTGWYNSNNKWYYFNGSGVMQTGWQKIGGKKYYIDGWGVMQTGWQKIGKKKYYFDSTGAMQTGWQKIGNNWYYFKSSGAMVTGKKKIGKKTYRFNSNGICLNR